jgi:hypothetical protein
MSKKNAKVKGSAALQELLGWSAGKPAIDKITPPDKRKAGDLLEVDANVVTSSAGQQFYWIVGTTHFIKKDDVDLM